MGRQIRSISIHSDRNGSLGLFLVFLACSAFLPVPALLAHAEVPGPWSSLGAWLGMVLLAAGYYLLFFTHKRYRVEPDRLTLQDGWLTRPRVFRWSGPVAIYLDSLEDGQKRWWSVELACGKPRYCLHRAADDGHESRDLALSLARALQCDLVEQDESGELLIPAEELALPLPERLRRHPRQLLPALPEPAASGVATRSDGSLLAFRWTHSPTQIAPYFLALVFFVGCLAALPLFPGPLPPHYQDWRGMALRRTAFERVSQDGNYDFFLLSGLFLAGVTALVAGHSVELLASHQALRKRTRLWGLTLAQTEIPLPELRQVIARRGRNGAYLDFISDHNSLGGRLARLEVARWIASEVQHFYARD